MPTEDTIVVLILQDIASKMRVPKPSTDEFFEINYVPGRNAQIAKDLIYKDGSTSYKGKKYPLMAVKTPFRERNGVVVIDRIVFATLTKEFTPVLDRYSDGGTFKSILYPCYNEFINQLCRSKYTLGQDISLFPHTKIDNAGEQPLAEGLNDFADILEIQNLEIKFNQIKTC